MRAGYASADVTMSCAPARILRYEASAALSPLIAAALHALATSRHVDSVAMPLAAAYGTRLRRVALPRVAAATR